MFDVKFISDVLIECKLHTLLMMYLSSIIYDKNNKVCNLICDGKKYYIDWWCRYTRIKILENGDFTFLDDMCKEEYGTLTKIEAERYF